MMYKDKHGRVKVGGENYKPQEQRPVPPTAPPKVFSKQVFNAIPGQKVLEAVAMNNDPALLQKLQSDEISSRLAVKPTIHYEVRFICYQYNCGGDASNGDFRRMEKFPEDKLEEARIFAGRIRRLAQPDHRNMSHYIAKNYVVAGFIRDYDGLYRIETYETKVKE